MDYPGWPRGPLYLRVRSRCNSLFHRFQHNRHIFSVPTRRTVIVLSYFTTSRCSRRSLVAHHQFYPRRLSRSKVRKLRLRCPDAAFADAITPVIKQWEVRTGGKVTLSREPMAPTDDSDIGIIPANSLGEWGEQGLLAPVPEELKAGMPFSGTNFFPFIVSGSWSGMDKL